MSEIEKQFFETFGIKPKKQCYYWDCPYSTGEIEKDTPINERDCVNCTNPDKEVYPQITDRILLNILKVLARNCYTVEIFENFIHQNKLEFIINIIKEPTRFHSHSEDFKMALLQAVKLLKDDEDVQVEVQALFKENN